MEQKKKSVFRYSFVLIMEWSNNTSQFYSLGFACEIMKHLSGICTHCLKGWHCAVLSSLKMKQGLSGLPWLLTPLQLWQKRKKKLDSFPPKWPIASKDVTLWLPTVLHEVLTLRVSCEQQPGLLSQFVTVRSCVLCLVRPPHSCSFFSNPKHKNAVSLRSSLLKSLISHITA